MQKNAKAEIFSARVATPVVQKVTQVENFLTRCGRPRTTDD